MKGEFCPPTSVYMHILYIVSWFLLLFYMLCNKCNLVWLDLIIKRAVKSAYKFSQRIKSYSLLNVGWQYVIFQSGGTSNHVTLARQGRVHMEVRAGPNGPGVEATVLWALLRVRDSTTQVAVWSIRGLFFFSVPFQFSSSRLICDLQI